MEQLSLAFKKTFSTLFVFVVIFMLSFGLFTEAALAQSQPAAGGGVNVNGNTVTTPAAQGTQAGTQAGTNTQGQQGMSLSEQGAVNGIAGCAASIVSSALSNVVGQLVGKFAGSDVYVRVGTTNSNTVAEGGDSNGSFPGLNAIGYCVINAVLEYLTQATIDWINSGFDGNPAFVDNPEQFFKDIADIETASFLQQVVQGTTGLDICEPFRLQIATGLAGNTGNSYARQSRCSFEEMGSALSESGVDFDYDEYTSGNSDYSGSLNAWRGTALSESNNYINAHFNADEELQKRLTRKGNTAQLDLTMGNGFLSFKKCEPGTTALDNDGNQIQLQGDCKTTTPGGVIEDQVNRALGAGRDRLILADKFDQIITALVNQLIKTALSEVLSGSEEE